MSRIKTVAAVVLLACVVLLVALGVATVVQLVGRGGAALNALRTSNADLAKDNATLSLVAKELPRFDRELGLLITEKRPNPKELRRLQRQVERLNSSVSPAPKPQPTATVTRTVRPPQPSHRPRPRPSGNHCHYVEPTSVRVCVPARPFTAPSRGRLKASPTYYDFNTLFTPLPIFHQGSVDCLREVWAEITDAYLRIYAQEVRAWDDSQVTWTQDQTNVCQYDILTPDGSFTASMAGCQNDYFTQRGLNPYTFTGENYALTHNGVLQASIPAGLGNMNSSWYAKPPKRLPILGVSPGDTTLDHAVLVVGVRPRGIIIQNSWGKTWGQRGRVILSWSFLSTYQVQINIFSWDNHTVDGLNL